MSKRLYLSIFATVLALVVGGLTYYTVHSADATSKNTNPSSLIGGWHQVFGNSTGGGFTMDISAGAIQIDYPVRDGSGGTFWMGTFDGTRKPAGKFVVKSLPDQDALKNDLLASNEKIKNFTYTDGVITFDFSVLKVHSVVRMVKNTD